MFCYVILANFEKLNETNNTLPKQLCGSAMISISFLPDLTFDLLYYNFSTFLTYIQESNSLNIYMLTFYLDVIRNLISFIRKAFDVLYVTKVSQAKSIQISTSNQKFSAKTTYTNWRIPDTSIVTTKNDICMSIEHMKTLPLCNFEL